MKDTWIALRLNNHYIQRPIAILTSIVYHGSGIGALKYESSTSQSHTLYARKSAFPAYESQMKLLFEDAELTDVAMGRAIRTIPEDGEQPSDTLRRALYDECNFQMYSLIYRSFTPDNSGNASGIKENDGRALWRHLVTFIMKLPTTTFLI